tara:strand:+ start:189 stop:371 length:183 start_codon:yes stop_codon:yes gene_type:complete
MEHIEEQLEELKGSIEIFSKWLNDERSDQIKEELINAIFDFHRRIFIRDLNKLIEDKLGK